MRGYPVISPIEMKELEKRAFAAGEDEEAYMRSAGKGIAKVIEKHLFTPHGNGVITLLIGKGNNGGDAFVVGKHLQLKGYKTKAYHLFPMQECSPLSQKMSQEYSSAGGQMHHLQSAPNFDQGIIVDGIFGTGFSDEVEGLLMETIEQANGSKLPIFAIDIPSGLNGLTGEVKSVAMIAHTTIYLGFPKIGFFIGSGWNHIGQLARVDFGLPKTYQEQAKPPAYLVCENKLHDALPPIVRSRHKYQAGYVLALAGSPSMPGAAMMSCLATLKIGAGIIRLFHPPQMESELSVAPYELIREEWDLSNSSRIEEEAKRAKALIIGPGMGREKAIRHIVETLPAKLNLPTVFDADALYFLAENPKIPLPKVSILTPHHGEMEKILGEKPNLENASRFASEKKITLVLKGAPTFVFHQGEKPIVIPRGDPGMAKAGTGDVLTGFITGLLAQGLDPCVAACLGVYLHAVAGELAACDETSYCVLATDLIEYVSDAIKNLQTGR